MVEGDHRGGTASEESDVTSITIGRKGNGGTFGVRSDYELKHATNY
jgi:hypothetical protein